MKSLIKKPGFTLLEVLIVVIIVGVLAAFSIPRLSAMKVRARSTEAFASLGIIRRSVERCYSYSGGNYIPCSASGVGSKDFSALDVDDPSDAPGSMYEYLVATGEDGYAIVAAEKGENGKYDTDNSISYFFDGSEMRCITLGEYEGICEHSAFEVAMGAMLDAG